MNASSSSQIAERYEALRASVLTHASGSDRRGLVLLRREGMAAWAKAWTCCLPVPTARDAPCPVQPDDQALLAESDAVVGLLASMALANIQEGLS